ncbi:MAG: hypothetical protein LBU65_17355 [Planctomycetaceae bacterium]|nr:hypothetical protein [Planctomycetaceae bacterium]
MKNTLSTPASQQLSNEPWWKFGLTTWLLLGGVVLLSGGFLLNSHIMDSLFLGLFNLVDFRTWAWWYFLCLIAVVAFSVRWFLLYQTYINDDFDQQDMDEVKWFCYFSGTITLIFAVFIFLHRFSFLNLFYDPLYFWLGQGAFSFLALLAFTAIFVVIGLIAFLAWGWISKLQGR